MNVQSPAEGVREIRELLRNDGRQLVTLKCDHSLKGPLNRACDCSDLIEFIHIQEPDERATSTYTEGIRRYFRKPGKLFLVPSWAYEFLSYIHKVVIQRLEAYGQDGGFEAFLSRYPHAQTFHDLWSSSQFEAAYKVYNDEAVWVDILSFTRDEGVEKLLINPLERFNALIAKGKFASISDYTGASAAPYFDEEIYSATFERLQELRGKSNRIRNDIDAKSLATVTWMNTCVDANFTAVTAAKFPLQAFYEVMEARAASGDTSTALSQTRSSLSAWIWDNVQSVTTPETVVEYLDQGIELVRDILQGIEFAEDVLGYATKAAGALPSKEEIGKRRKIAEATGLLHYYAESYREPIFRPTESFGTDAAAATPEKLSARAAAEAMKPQSFQEAMRRAREMVRPQSIEMAERSEKFVRSGELALTGKPLTQLYAELLADFKRQRSLHRASA